MKNSDLPVDNTTMLREVKTPQVYTAPETMNLSDILLAHQNQTPQPSLFSVLDDKDKWQSIPYQNTLDDIKRIAKGLIASGIKPNDKIAIMSRTRYEWVLIDFAIIFAGAISVPIYETSSPSQVAWILKDSETVTAFVENSQHEQVLQEGIERDELKNVKNIIQIEDGGLEALKRAGAQVSDEELERRRTQANKHDTATIIYTSGTTGPPKGCELTHANFIEANGNTAAAVSEIIKPEINTLLFLPLAHVFARFFSFICVDLAIPVAHTPDTKSLLTDLQSFKPMFILAVPRVFEKVYMGAQTNADSHNRRSIFDKAAGVATEYSKAKEKGKVPIALKAQHRFFDLLVYKKLKAAMGGRLEFAVSGGAPIGPDLAHFFDGIGVPVLQGYGLTETTAPLSVNTFRDFKVGTVGPPLPGNEVRIAGDGEIQARGVSVMKKYHNIPTEDAFEKGGWFPTGDLGTIDENGYLRITGRKKDVIVTAAGKNVIPNVLEDPIRRRQLISQAVVIGEQQPFISTLISLDEETLPEWLESNGLDKNLTMTETIKLKEVHQEIQDAIAEANDGVSRAEQIKEYRILPYDLTQTSGHLTPSLKVKRNIVMENFSTLIDDIYSTIQ